MFIKKKRNPLPDWFTSDHVVRIKNGKMRCFPRMLLRCKLKSELKKFVMANDLEAYTDYPVGLDS